MKPEQFEQIYLMDWVATQADIKKYLIHIRNEGKRSWNEGRVATRMGLRKGVSDLFLALPNKKYAGMWIELKAMKGKTTVHQREWLELMRSAGYHADVYYGWVEAAKAISEYVGKEFRG